MLWYAILAIIVAFISYTNISIIRDVIRMMAEEKRLSKDIHYQRWIYCIKLLRHEPNKRPALTVVAGFIATEAYDFLMAGQIAPQELLHMRRLEARLILEKAEDYMRMLSVCSEAAIQIFYEKDLARLVEFYKKDSQKLWKLRNRVSSTCSMATLSWFPVTVIYGPAISVIALFYLAIFSWIMVKNTRDTSFFRG